MIAGALTVTTQCEVCDNVTNGGEIASDQTFCGNSFNPEELVNVTLHSGGSGALEYI